MTGGGMTNHRSFTLDDLLSPSWDRKIVLSVVDELVSLPDKGCNDLEEVRRFLALKSYRELLRRVETARKNQSSLAAVRSMARAIHQFGVERPALFTAALRKPRREAIEIRETCHQIYELLLDVFAECGVSGQAADQAIHILQCLIRGFVLDELLNRSPCSHPDEGTYEAAIDLFIAGLSALLSSDLLAR
jgi:hypothetical protein